MDNKKIINITVKNKRAAGDGTVLVCDNSDYRLRFTFDADWDGMNAKTARMVWGVGKYRDFPFTGNEVDIDRLPVANMVSIGVYAGDIKTSTPAIFKCNPSILSSNPVHEPPPEDVYNKLVDMIEEMNDPVPRMPVIDADMKEDTPEGRVYNAELHAALKDRDRVYAELPAKDGGGVSPMFYLSANADKLFNPIGYTSLEEMCEDCYLPIDMAIEGTNYTKITIDGKPTYHPRLYSVVVRTLDGRQRVADPRDSSDATPKRYVDSNDNAVKAEIGKLIDEKDAELKQYVDKYSFAKYANQSGADDDKNAGNGYKVMMLGSKAKSTYLTGTSVNGDANTFMLRLADGSSRAKMPADIDKADSTTLVNLGHFNTKIKSVEAIAKGRGSGYVFNTVAELDSWLANSDNKAKLAVGDNFYIRAKDVPDYWWDGTQKQELETQKVNLSEYAEESRRYTDGQVSNLRSYVYTVVNAAEEEITKKAEIVDVPELPMPESIGELLTYQNKLYRTNKAEGTLIAMNGAIAGQIDMEVPATVFVVPTLPEVGNTSTEEHYYIYFCVSDGAFYYGTGDGNWGSYFFNLPIVSSRDDVAQLMDCVAFLPESTTSDMYALNPLASFDGNPFIKLTEKGGNTAGSTVGEWMTVEAVDGYIDALYLTESGVYEYYIVIKGVYPSTSSTFAFGTVIYDAVNMNDGSFMAIPQNTNDECYLDISAFGGMELVVRYKEGSFGDKPEGLFKVRKIRDI